MALVILIMLLSTIGSVVLIVLCGSSMWSFIYLIKYRLLKYPTHTARNEVSAMHDIVATVICLISLVVFVAMLIYGMPIVIKYLPEINELLTTSIIETK